MGVVLLVGLAVGLVLLLTGDDDKNDKDGRDKGSSSAEPSASGSGGAAGDPADVVEALLDEAEAGDCDAAQAYLTTDAQAGDPCSSEEFEFLSSGDVETEVGDAEVDGDTATVPVDFTESAVTQSYDFTLEAVDGEWLVADWTPSLDLPPPPSSSTTDDPTGGSTGAPSGGSTAASVPNDPASVAEALYQSTLNSDCATANDLVTEEFKAREGECDPTDAPTEGFDPSDFTIEAGEPVYNAARDEATVPVDLGFMGTTVPTTFTLIQVDGRWLVDAVDGEM
ncbi:hypothetical protein E9934_16485 [Nocardioides caeni]|uniref:DUF4878 domain-containing protein n=1 Tax=Nocardioides caeni TaxID=574700 RepID=A0A4S8N0S0_9ACTN|nr:hypothetical protein E9934_16485 [Nocardioides caeni]